MTVYRGLDQAELDAQYDNRARVPEALEFIARWSDMSAAVRARRPAHLDVAYGPDPAERLDIFPAAVPGAPLHLFFHGGYWKMLGKNDFAFLADAFVPAGVCLAVVNYGLCPTVTLTELVRQCRAATEFCYRHAGDWRADGGRLTVSGHSAGGHLVALMLATHWPSFGRGLVTDLVKGGIAMSGLYDLEPIRLCALNGKLGLDADEAAALSPIHGVPASAGKLVLAVGADESQEFQCQQADFARAWRAAGLVAHVVNMAGHNHFSILDAFAHAASPLHRAALEVIGVS